MISWKARVHITAAAIAAVYCVAAAAKAQAPTAAQHFEVASVKPVAHFDPMHSDAMAIAIPGRVIFQSITLRLCIEKAYGVSTYQLGGGPRWLDSAYFTIVATARKGASVADEMQMMRALLAERFRLQLRQETRMLPGYILTVAKSGFKIPPADPKSYNPLQPGIGSLTMAQIAERFGARMHAPVADRTGLAGRYDLYGLAGRTGMMIPRGPDGAPAMTFPQLVQRRFGLALTPGKIPLPYLEIIHVERPTPN